jgi:hypothetical protein
MKEENEKKNSDSPVIKRLFGIKNELLNSLQYIDNLETQFGKIDSALLPEPRAKEDTKSKDFSDMTLSEKLARLENLSIEIEKRLVILNENFDKFM